MRDQINKENYEIIFFQLTEGEYSDYEEELLLEAIDEDSFLAFEWENWKKAQLSNSDLAMYEENYTEFFDGIKKEGQIFKTQEEEKKKTKVIPFFWTISSVAACILLVLFYIGSNVSTPIDEATFVEDYTDILDSKNTDTVSASVKEHANTVENKTKPVTVLETTTPATELTASVEPKIPDSSAPSTKQTESLLPEEENSNLVAVEQPTDNNLIKDTSFVRLVKESEIDHLLESIDTTFIAPKSIAKNSPQRKLKFSVEKSKLPPQIILTSLAQLSDLNIDVTELMEDQKVFVMRNADGLFLRLEKDGGEILIALR